jgi:hypothetical protein
LINWFVCLRLRENSTTSTSNPNKVEKQLVPSRITTLSQTTDKKTGKRTIHRPGKGLLELHYSWRRHASSIAFGNKPNLQQSKEAHSPESETLNPGHKGGDTGEITPSLSKQHSLTESFGAKCMRWEESRLFLKD